MGGHKRPRAGHQSILDASHAMALPERRAELAVVAALESPVAQRNLAGYGKAFGGGVVSTNAKERAPDLPYLSRARKVPGVPYALDRLAERARVVSWTRRSVPGRLP